MNYFSRFKTFFKCIIFTKALLSAPSLKDINDGDIFLFGTQTRNINDDIICRLKINITRNEKNRQDQFL